MSSLLSPIHSAKQKCRPKHQVLVLKCYPKYQKTVQEVKPMSSELSYLLYYASTRRHKLQKVGDFLEKKTAGDVWKRRLGNVQVTLQILTAIIEKAPRDLSLYSKSVLTILDSVLRSGDVNMVEDSIPTFEAYCKVVSSASLTADQHRAQQYLAIVQHYAGFAAKKKPVDKKTADSIPLSLRWRTIGLRAIRAIVASDALATDSNRQLNIVMPVILENMSLEEDNILSTLQQRVKTSERTDDESARRRRMSIATVTTVDTVEGDPAAAVETTAGADKVAEDEVRTLALRCLKQIFSVGIGSTRGQTRLATALTLKFIASRNPPKVTPETSRAGNWATSLFEAIARWTPVQDRFIIVVTAMETLVRSPMVEGVLEKQLVLTTMIDWLLSSSVNLIGLSVMDVLLGFIQHMLVLLQLGGPNGRFTQPSRQDTLGFYKEAKEAFDPSSLLTQEKMGRVPSKELIASPVRQELLERLQKCIASLSNHIYYTDQITDMLTAILARLKPSPQSEVPTTAAAINDPAAATKAIAESISIQEDANSSTFFSFATARITASRVIKEILNRANNRRNATGAPIEARARVGVQVWEGTQWLLKDEDREVRYAYIDALLTWLKVETNKSDTLLPKDGSQKKPVPKKHQGENGVAKRAVSNASRKEAKMPARSNFLALLHLAIYDSILDEAENETNILLLYLLLTKLIERLGVNAVRSGLPMILRLQETALNGEVVSAVGRVNVGSVVHGYLWTIADKFDFETSPIGHEINAEISRRKRFGIWFDKIKFPALPMEEVKRLEGRTEKVPFYNEEAVETIRPFLSIGGIVEEVANAYDLSLLTPQNSPPSSPGRVFSVPTLGFGYGYGVAPAQKASRGDHLPQRVKEEMTAGWSREACIAAVEKESTGSVTGSRTGASSIPKHHLGVNGSTRRHGSVSGKESPAAANGATTPTYGLVGGLGTLTQIRRPSANGSPARVPTTSSRDSTVRVSDLKRALSGYAVAGRRQSPTRRPQAGSRRSTGSSSTSSMLSWDDADDRNPSFLNVGAEATNGTTTHPKASESNKLNPEQTTGTYHDQVTANPTVDADVPPVPKIPSTLNLPGTWPQDASRDPSPVRPDNAHEEIDPLSQSPKTRKITNTTHSPSSIREKQSLRKTSRPTSRRSFQPRSSSPIEKFDLGSLLAAIPTTGPVGEPEKENRASRPIKPPY
ncbi:plasma membrane localization protein [Cladophialophora chaetospira]|uniref:Plasma membrane localization protein n=1 Tax=Cladophialophora chaetospira TaxID=386627 RepID=A0AA38X769_9EURO|nr:plasma membrane localization protein [Cladophialophora chaetospira]